MTNSKRVMQNQKRSSYVHVSTRGSPTTSRSSSPTTSNANEPTSTGQSSSSDAENIDPLNEVEKKLFDLVLQGNWENLNEFIQNNRHVDVNKRDIEGMGILQKAVLKNEVNLIDLLLNSYNDFDVSDALLSAIENNFMPIVIKILDWKKNIREHKKKIITEVLFPIKEIKSDISIGSEYYGDDINPMIMAAMHGHYELIELLHKAGERLSELHLPACGCPNCTTVSASSDLQKSNKRIKLLKALANPEYLAFVAGIDKTFDPVLRAFELCDLIQKCIDQEPEFKAEYEEILKNIREFPTSLLELCRNEDETQILLGQKEGYNGMFSSFPRLLLAIDTGQKTFVAHNKVQDVLYQKWIGEQKGEWTLESGLLMIFLAVLSPLTSVLLFFTICCGDTKLVKFMASPKIRFCTSGGSYLLFLLIILFMNSGEKSIALFGPPSHYLPWIVATYVLSHLVSFLKHWLLSSSKHFILSGWNIFEFVNYIFFATSIGLWIALLVRDNDRRCTRGRLAIFKRCLNIERSELENGDIQLLSEITIAIASTMAGLRFLRLFILHTTLGPLQIALGKMSKDIAMFVAFFIVIIFSFALGIQHMYRPYQKLKPSCVLCDFLSTLESLSWALFTMTDVSSPIMPTWPVALGKGKTSDIHLDFTESVGKLIFLVYHILCVSFLLSMLGSVMNNRYSNIMGNVLVEWKYERAKMWIYYIQDTTITPPFNIFPNFKKIGGFILCTKGKRFFCDPEDDESDQDKRTRDRKYRNLIRRLFQRYFRSNSSHESKDPPAAKDINAVQKQLSELKDLTEVTLKFHSNLNSESRRSI